ncbi:MAG: hypothetical protein RL603_1092, partial [Pseudomonadota bacterium]
VKVARRFDPASIPAVVAARAQAERQLGDRGRVVLRASGTEPLIRVMIESDDHREAETLANSIADVVRAVEG